MDAAQNVQGPQQKHQQQYGSKKFDKRPDPLAYVASEVEALSTASSAFPLWEQLFGKIVSENFRLPAKVMYDFVDKCPRPVNGERNLPVEFVTRHWTDKVLREVADPKVDAERIARRFATHLQLANFVGAAEFLKARVAVEEAFRDAGADLPKDVADRIRSCDSWRLKNGGYTMEQLVDVGFKRSFAQEGLYKDPITGAEISVGGRKPTNDDRRGRHSFSRRNDDMLSHFGDAKEREHKHKKIPVLTREAMEANRLAKIEGRLARRVAAHKAASDRKQQQAAAKKAAGEKKGGKRAQSK